MLVVGTLLFMGGCAMEDLSYWRSIGLEEAPRWADGRPVTPEEYQACLQKCRQIQIKAQQALEYNQWRARKAVEEAQLRERKRLEEAEINRRLYAISADGIITKNELLWALPGISPDHTQVFASRKYGVTEVWYYGGTQFVFENGVLERYNKW